jgi:hypothetical protein
MPTARSTSRHSSSLGSTGCTAFHAAVVARSSRRSALVTAGPCSSSAATPRRARSGRRPAPGQPGRAARSRNHPSKRTAQPTRAFRPSLTLPAARRAGRRVRLRRGLSGTGWAASPGVGRGAPDSLAIGSCRRCCRQTLRCRAAEQGIQELGGVARRAWTSRPGIGLRPDGR